MMRLSAMLFSASLAVACAGSEEAAPSPSPSPSPAPSPSASPATPVAVAIDAAAPVAPPAPKSAHATPSIASVTLEQDCRGKIGIGGGHSGGYTKPDRKSKAKRAKGSGPLRQPCSQSMLQIAFAGQGAESAQVTLGEIRLKSSSGDTVATLSTRHPMIWQETHYATWDGMLPANADSKSSYHLSMPNWGEVEAVINGSSFNHMFTVEVDVTIGEATTTITSPEVERSRPLMIKT